MILLAVQVVWGINMVEGAFSFISGEIAKTGPDAMLISTPVATVGIRGTTVAGKAAVEGNENAFYTFTRC